MSFGYSIGDFITGANMSYRLIQALSGTQCTSQEYREAIIEIGCLQQTFLQVGRMTSIPTLSPATINAASHIVLSSMTLIGDFLKKTQKLRERFDGRGSGNAVSDSWQKLGWVLFKKEDLNALKNALHVKLANISLLLDTAQFQEDMPRHVAKYQVKNLSDSSPPPSYAHLADDQANVMGSSYIFVNNRTVLPSNQNENPQDEKSADFEARFARIEKLLQQQKSQESRASYTQLTEATKTNISSDVEQTAPVNKASRLQKLKPHPGIESIAQELAEIPLTPAEMPTQPTLEDMGLFSRFEAFLRSQRQKEVHDAKLITQLEEILSNYDRKKNYGTEKDRPVKFKDAVGRKFIFPFHLVKTWAGMEQIIRQTFAHVNVIGPLVAQGHYDLIGPSGEIILPQVWETTVEPDWSVTMHMWPVEEPPSRERLLAPAACGPPPLAPAIVSSSLTPPPPNLEQSSRTPIIRRASKIRGWISEASRRFKGETAADSSGSGSDSD